MNEVSQLQPKAKYDPYLNWFLALFCILLPFEEALAGSFGSVVKLVGLGIMAYAVFTYKKIIIRRISWLLIAWLLIAAATVFGAVSFELWSHYFMMYASQVAFLLVVAGMPAGKVNLQTFRRGLRIGALAAALIIILMPQTSDMDTEGRRTIILFGREFDPNVVSAIIILGVSSCMEELFGAQNRRKQGFFFLEILVLLLGIFFTGSRGGLISACVTGAVTLYTAAKDRKNQNTIRKFVVIGALIIIAAIPFLPTNLLEGRFSADTIFGQNEWEKGAHNRYSIWLSALKLIPERPFFGHGVGNFYQIIRTVYFRKCAAHNLYVLLIVETGVVGFLLFFAFIISLFIRLRRQRKPSVFGVLCGMLVMSMTLDSLMFKFFWVALLWAMLALKEQEQ